MFHHVFYLPWWHPFFHIAPLSLSEATIPRKTERPRGRTSRSAPREPSPWQVHPQDRSAACRRSPGCPRHLKATRQQEKTSTPAAEEQKSVRGNGYVIRIEYVYIYTLLWLIEE